MKYHFLIIFIGFIVGGNLLAMDRAGTLKKLEESGVSWNNENSDITGPFDWCINASICPKAVMYSPVKIIFENKNETKIHKSKVFYRAKAHLRVKPQGSEKEKIYSLLVWLSKEFIDALNKNAGYNEGNLIYYHITDLSSKNDFHPYLPNRCHSKRGKGKKGNKVRFSIDVEKKPEPVPQSTQTTNNNFTNTDKAYYLFGGALFTTTIFCISGLLYKFYHQKNKNDDSNNQKQEPVVTQKEEVDSSSKALVK